MARMARAVFADIPHHITNVVIAKYKYRKLEKH